MKRTLVLLAVACQPSSPPATSGPASTSVSIPSAASVSASASAARAETPPDEVPVRFRNAGVCSSFDPSTAPKQVATPPTCGRAFRARVNGPMGLHGEPPAPGPKGPDVEDKLPGTGKRVQVIHSAEEYRRLFTCEPPAGFDFTQARLALLIDTYASNAPTGLRAVEIRGERIALTYATGQSCQGMTPISTTTIHLVALPHDGSLDLEFCHEPVRPCGPVP